METPLRLHEGGTVMARDRRRLAALALMALAIAAAQIAPAVAQDPTPSSPTTPGTVTLVGYTTPREAYAELIPLFQATPEGQGVTFEESYGPSGDQSRAVSAGLPADVVALALWPDVERLVEPGIVAPDWDENEYAGIIHDSVVSFAVRPGNPKAIHTWEDLARDDVVVITPNPITSGGAQWNILAAYQAQVLAGRTDEEAIDYLTRLAARVAVWDRGARDALTTFANGQGDVLLAYENEALFAQDSGVPLEVIVPDATILIENPIAATLTGDAPAQAQAFVDFVSTPDAQRVYARHHFRPVVPKVLAEFTFSAPPQLFTVADVGGWAEARPRFFDPDTGIMARVFQTLGIGA